MKKTVIIILLSISALCSISFKTGNEAAYRDIYHDKLSRFKGQLALLLKSIDSADLDSEAGIAQIKQDIQLARNELKPLDFWFRYLEPLAYKKINGPLPVEWETEVFEKFEAPYKREGAGLTLAALYLDEDHVSRDSLRYLISQSADAAQIFNADSITVALKTYHHFFLCNRLYLLNLAAIYTTGFECPDADRIIPELRLMLSEVNNIYTGFNESFPATPLTNEYLSLYKRAIRFAMEQPADYKLFDHFHFIKDFINPLFILNQKMINQYNVVSRSMVDYSLNKKEISIFSKELYNGQNAKGIFLRVEDKDALTEIDRLGKLLFYDPLLSGNNMRSCASCHKPTEFLTDTATTTAFQFNHREFLPRNSPSLINAGFNHLLMLDGKHFTLQNQTKAVIGNELEMGGGNEQAILERVLSCDEYKKGFQKLLKYTPTEKQIDMDHIVSAITFYYAKFSKFYSPFDEAINGNKPIDATVRDGFNLFMSKAQCATCHFIPQFNGVKPPYVGSEFEVLGVPEDKTFKKLSADKGRFLVNPAGETLNAFRTGTVRNAAHTMPYMHNGVFTNLKEVIDFYDAGGGVGRGLKLGNQTLSPDSLKLSSKEKSELIAFIGSLNENITMEAPPSALPKSKNKSLNTRKVGGEY